MITCPICGNAWNGNILGCKCDYRQKIGEQEFKFREPGVKIWEQQMALTPFGEQELHAAGWRRCAEGQKETQHCALLEAAVLAEREACVKACNAVIDRMHEEGEGPTGNIGWVKDCIYAIRARGKE